MPRTEGAMCYGIAKPGKENDSHEHRDRWFDRLAGVVPESFDTLQAPQDSRRDGPVSRQETPLKKKWLQR